MKLYLLLPMVEYIKALYRALDPVTADASMAA